MSHSLALAQARLVQVPGAETASMLTAVDVTRCRKVQFV
jgi:hypothetical protein